MRVEKISNNKVRIFISYDDLEARGIEKEEMWQNGKKVQELFWDMMEIAYTEVGFEIIGPIAVEAFSMPKEGVVVIVTQVPSLPRQAALSDVPDIADEPNDPFQSSVFRFKDFEDVIRAISRLATFTDFESSLYAYKGNYHLFFEDDKLDDATFDAVFAILNEYAEVSSTTPAVLIEYGKVVAKQNAIEVVTRYFA
nr:NDP-hexose 2,3-dehydratase [Bacilli bacterium]